MALVAARYTIIIRARAMYLRCVCMARIIRVNREKISSVYRMARNPSSRSVLTHRARAH